MARRSKRRQVKRRQTKRVQSGGGFFTWEGIKSLFTGKAAPAPEANTFSMVNPMPPAPPAVNAEANARRLAALNNMTKRRRLGQSHIVNLQRNIRNEQEINNELAGLMGSTAPLGNRNVLVPENLQRRRNARSANNWGAAYANVQATGRALEQPLALRGGGLTKAQIDRLANNI
jgi:hypothetical protein